MLCYSETAQHSTTTHNSSFCHFKAVPNHCMMIFEAGKNECRRVVGVKKALACSTGSQSGTAGSIHLSTERDLQDWISPSCPPTNPHQPPLPKPLLCQHINSTVVRLLASDLPPKHYKAPPPTPICVLRLWIKAAVEEQGHSWALSHLPPTAATDKRTLG